MISGRLERWPLGVRPRRDGRARVIRLRALFVLIAVLALAGGRARVASAASPLPPIKHVFIIVLENKAFDETFGFYSPAPYLSLTLPGMGAFVPNYYGVTHESLGNYVAMVSGQGSNLQTQTDCQIYTPLIPGIIGADGQAIGTGCVYPSAVQTIAGQLSARGLSWKGYMEDMGNAAGQSQTCRHPALSSSDSTQTARVGDEYAARHNPFVYFQSLLDSGACARDDVPLDRLPGDLSSAASTPNYSFITPNLCNDGHDSSCAGGRGAGGLAGADQFLRLWVPRIMGSPAYRAGGLLAIVFDETSANDATACCAEPQFPNTTNNGLTAIGRGGGRTGAVLLSPFIDPGTIDLAPYNHFTLLRSIEDLFGLDHLGYAAAPGAQSLGADAFTCFDTQTPRARRGRLPAGSEVKLAVIGQGTAPRPMVELKLFHAGRVSVQAVRSGARRGRGRGVGHAQTLSPCQLLKVPLPFVHGRATITARAFGGAERRTIGF